MCLTIVSFQAEIAKRATLQQNAAENQNLRSGSTEPSNLQSCLTNLIVLVGFAAFAFTVKYVMKTSASEE